MRTVQAYETQDNVKEKTLDDGTVVETRKPKNERLVASIEIARLAVARSFYTDAADLFPAPGAQAWWETWLRNHFCSPAKERGCGRPNGRAAAVPVARKRCDHLTALATLIPNNAAVAPQLSPDTTDAATRSRRSFE